MKCKTCGGVIPLRVGDRVKAIGDVNGLNLRGKEGVVKIIDKHLVFPVLVEFDKALFNGHNGYSGYGKGRCKFRRGWWGRHENYKVVKRHEKA